MLILEQFNKTISQQTADLDRADNTRLYFILEEAKETILDFLQGTVKVL